MPCSKVTHLTKNSLGTSEYQKPPFKTEFSDRNLKRVAEVWLDEYKEALYNTNREVFNAIDPGDLTKAFEVKKRLHCKSFKYFLEVIARDLAEIWPPFELPKFAYGTINSVGKPTQCFTRISSQETVPIKLRACIKSPTKPVESQNFELTWHKFIKYSPNEGYVAKLKCLDLNNDIKIISCHYNFGNQYVKFDLVRIHKCRFDFDSNLYF